MIRSAALLLVSLCSVGVPIYAASALKRRVQLAGSTVDSACSTVWVITIRLLRSPLGT